MNQPFKSSTSSNSKLLACIGEIIIHIESEAPIPQWMVLCKKCSDSRIMKVLTKVFIHDCVLKNFAVIDICEASKTRHEQPRYSSREFFSRRNFSPANLIKKTPKKDQSGMRKRDHYNFVQFGSPFSYQPDSFYCSIINGCAIRPLLSRIFCVPKIHATEQVSLQNNLLLVITVLFEDQHLWYPGTK